jgi:hypothetical protein
MKRTKKMKRFHVYADDGFEGAFTSERSSLAAAKRGSKNRRVDYTVVVTGPSGISGGGSGRTIATFRRGEEV